MVWLVFRLWLAEGGFTLSQRQATSKVSIDIFVRFPLASLAGRSVHTTGQLPPAATLRTKKGYQLAGRAGKKWNAVPLALNSKALDPNPGLFAVSWLSTSSSLASRVHRSEHVKCSGQ